MLGCKHETVGSSPGHWESRPNFDKQEFEALNLRKIIGLKDFLKKHSQM